MCLCERTKEPGAEEPKHTKALNVGNCEVSYKCTHLDLERAKIVFGAHSSQWRIRGVGANEHIYGVMLTCALCIKPRLAVTHAAVTVPEVSVLVLLRVPICARIYPFCALKYIRRTSKIIALMTRDLEAWGWFMSIRRSAHLAQECCFVEWIEEGATVSHPSEWQSRDLKFLKLSN